MSGHITEPMTMLTDYLLAAGCAILSLSLLRKTTSRGRREVLLWIVGLFLAAIAALAGGTAHGFELYLGPTLHALIWKVTVFSIGLSAMVILWAGIRSARHPPTRDRGGKQRGHRWLQGGILMTVTALLIQRSGGSLHQHFNHNDIYHLVQLVGIYFLYRGACLLHDL